MQVQRNQAESVSADQSIAGGKRSPVFLTVAEAAALLRVDDVTVGRAIRAGEFPAVRIRKRYVIPRRAIEMLVEDVLNAGTCVDIAEWTAGWRAKTGAPVEVPSWAL